MGFDGLGCIQQEWCESRLGFHADSDRLYAKPPKVGLVIGTFAAVPYVHLQLEARRRYCPQVPVLVHDDFSPFRGELSALCRRYGSDFESNSERMPHHLGDLSAFIGGLKWAERRGIELLVKLSRRWVFLTDWAASARDLAFESQYATLSSYTISYGFGFRTECIGMAVKLWAGPRFFRSAIEKINIRKHVFIENYIHNFAVDFEQMNCTHADAWKAQHPMADDRQGYAQWPLMGTDRITAAPAAEYIWHDSHKPAAYAALAAEWRLPYAEHHFSDPNQGCGTGNGCAR